MTMITPDSTAAFADEKWVDKQPLAWPAPRARTSFCATRRFRVVDKSQLGIIRGPRYARREEEVKKKKAWVELSAAIAVLADTKPGLRSTSEPICTRFWVTVHVSKRASACRIFRITRLPLASLGGMTHTTDDSLGVSVRVGGATRRTIGELSYLLYLFILIVLVFISHIRS